MSKPGQRHVYVSTTSLYRSIRNTCGKYENKSITRGKLAEAIIKDLHKKFMKENWD